MNGWKFATAAVMGLVGFGAMAVPAEAAQVPGQIRLSDGTVLYPHDNGDLRTPDGALAGKWTGPKLQEVQAKKTPSQGSPVGGLLGDLPIGQLPLLG